MMGNPNEASSPNGQHHHGGRQNATFSGATALLAIVALILEIIVVAVPHWGYYLPSKGYISSGRSSQDGSGHFGPFQSCQYAAYHSYCGGNTYFEATAWLIGAGICSVIAVLALSLVSLFSCLHVSMQLQRTEICVKFSTAVFVKLLSAAVAVVSVILAVILASVHFSYGGRGSGLSYDMGICYYIQIVLIFVTILLAVMSFLSYRKARRNPLPMVPRNGAAPSSVHYDVRNNTGVSMTSSSGYPYQHGQPRLPNQPQPQAPSYAQQQHMQPIAVLQPGQQQQQQQGYVNNGFTPVTLSVPTQPQQQQQHHHQQVTIAGQPVPSRPIQPVQGIPQNSYPQQYHPQHHQQQQHFQQPQQQHSYSPQQQLPPQQPAVSAAPVPASIPVAHASINLNPGGRHGAGGGGGGGGRMSGAGSMESLNSTNSNLSQYSFGSTISTGSGVSGPLRSSLKKPKNKDKQSISSETSSKRVRLSLGSEQTSV